MYVYYKITGVCASGKSNFWEKEPLTFLCPNLEKAHISLAGFKMPGGLSSKCSWLLTFL